MNDKENGYGNYIHNNGKTQVGYWINDIFTGLGYEYGGNECYIGSFRNGDKNGIGKFKIDNNIIYEGEWKNNNYNGIGINIMT